MLFDAVWELMGICLVAARWLRRFAAATARNPRDRALHAQTDKWSAHGTRERATCEPQRHRN
eukprot:10691545-Lingulodinium_polyedra.AAC.1